MSDSKPFKITSYIDDNNDGRVLTPKQQHGCVRGKLLVCFPGVNRTGNRSAESLTGDVQVVRVTGEMWLETTEVIKDHIANGKVVVYTTAQDCFTYLREAGIPFTVVYPKADLQADYYKRLFEDCGGDYVGAHVQMLHWAKLQEMFRAQLDCNHVEMYQPQIWIRDLIESGFFK